jgi:beta-phosphoglucomutase family hydrolase
MGLAASGPVRAGLPSSVRACLFDLDGVLTSTARVHAAAWKAIFDAYLEQRARSTGAALVPFDIEADYEQYVDGKPRADGTRSFLVSRGVRLPEGRPDDPPDAETVQGLSKRKDAVFARLLQEKGVSAYEGSVRYVRAVRGAGLLTAVVSSSRHCRQILSLTGIRELFDTIVDGVTAQEMKLAGKPAPDTYLAAARQLGVGAPASAVFEDALAGVEAGRRGGFGYVVGVDHRGRSRALLERGANVVVSDLAELLERR